MGKLNPNPQLGQGNDLGPVKTQITAILTAAHAQINALSEGGIDAAYTASTAAPTTGSHKQGDFIRNTAPTGSYPISGWLCTASGTPGTWVALSQTDLTAYSTTAAQNALYRDVRHSSASHTAGQVAGTYAIGDGNVAAVSGTGTLAPQGVFYFDPADYGGIGGLTTKCRLRAFAFANDVAPTGNYTLGLYPVTRPATSGGAGVDIYTLGTVVAGSTVAFTTPAADSANQGNSGDFTAPAAGFYVIGMVTTATVAASSHLHVGARLQVHNA